MVLADSTFNLQFALTRLLFFFFFPFYHLSYMQWYIFLICGLPVPPGADKNHCRRFSSTSECRWGNLGKMQPLVQDMVLTCDFFLVLQRRTGAVFKSRLQCSKQQDGIWSYFIFYFRFPLILLEGNLCTEALPGKNCCSASSPPPWRNFIHSQDVWSIDL